MRSDLPLDIVLFGLSVTSAWGNGHATTYRALTRALADRGHRLRFYERDVPWYAGHRDLPQPPWMRTVLYRDLEALQAELGAGLRADLVIVGSYVPEGGRLIEWLLPRVEGLTAFYDIDTPVTVARLGRGDCDYLQAQQVERFDLYLSFAGGPVLERLRQLWGARRPRPLYCSVDPRDYFPTRSAKRHDLGYLGTFSPDRQGTLERLLLEPARRWPAGRFSVAGAQYPPDLQWPDNVAHTEHLAPDAHRGYYNSQRCTLNVTRADMVANGWSPSVRLFEAAACGVPIISDPWPGLEDFLAPGTEVVLAQRSDEVLYWLREAPAPALAGIGTRARARVLAAHTAAHRAIELEQHVAQARAAGKGLGRVA